MARGARWCARCCAVSPLFHARRDRDTVRACARDFGVEVVTAAPRGRCAAIPRAGTCIRPRAIWSPPTYRVSRAAIYHLSREHALERRASWPRWRGPLPMASSSGSPRFTGARRGSTVYVPSATAARLRGRDRRRELCGRRARLADADGRHRSRRRCCRDFVDLAFVDQLAKRGLAIDQAKQRGQGATSVGR